MAFVLLVSQNMLLLGALPRLSICVGKVKEFLRETILPVYQSWINEIKNGKKKSRDTPL